MKSNRGRKPTLFLQYNILEMTAVSGASNTAVKRPTLAPQLRFLAANASRNLYFLPIATTYLRRLHIPLSYIAKAFCGGSSDQALVSPQVAFQREHCLNNNAFSST